MDTDGDKNIVFADLPDSCAACAFFGAKTKLVGSVWKHKKYEVGSVCLSALLHCFFGVGAVASNTVRIKPWLVYIHTMDFTLGLVIIQYITL